MSNHLTLEERDRIAQLRCRGANQKEIARALKRSPATISRELRRNLTEDEYYRQVEEICLELARIYGGIEKSLD